MGEYLAYIFWFIHLVFGSLIDARMWGKKEDDPKWLAEYFDFFWLGYFSFSPFFVQYLVMSGLDLFTVPAIVGGFGCSVFWDLIYCKIEHGEWIHPLPYWLVLPNPFSRKQTWEGRRILIGTKTKRGTVVFGIVRIALLAGVIFI